MDFSTFVLELNQSPLIECANGGVIGTGLASGNGVANPLAGSRKSAGVAPVTGI